MSCMMQCLVLRLLLSCVLHNVMVSLKKCRILQIREYVGSIMRDPIFNGYLFSSSVFFSVCYFAATKHKQTTEMIDFAGCCRRTKTLSFREFVFFAKTRLANNHCKTPLTLRGLFLAFMHTLSLSLLKNWLRG